MLQFRNADSVLLFMLNLLGKMKSQKSARASSRPNYPEPDYLWRIPEILPSLALGL